ncbi:uncharacterized protein CC84DRAFT_1170361 [Paraphaeosphaeria sporulosa]|uniref:BTB domain-containing protein n=1 Tax=Paraphaeosphaeria sporulosa TaxID=1460663 RepID=A0A177CX73_9PLEO|nr:uncharacterized protein CC84DRAFT_1170361 [Paraphaeosphaeria sporulosa]OAG11460.1 hypothetical protein CC84DRAFT_1170361 [Paraphaeosphaeria sporulosa]
MAPTFEDLIQSHQFTFFVGEEGKSIVVHAAAIAATSQQLDALINGGMEESEKRCARIGDVRVDDFIRFCEYAYRGDYTVPPWGQRPSDLSKKDQQNGHYDECAPLSAKEKKKRKKSQVTFGFLDAPPPMEPPQQSLVDEDIPAPETPPMDMEYPDKSRTLLRIKLNSRRYLSNSSPRAVILKDFDPKLNSAADQDFTPVLLAHARLYCFAHLRLIAPLKELTLHKLHKTLMTFRLYTQRVGDIIELARYAYSSQDLPDRSDDGTLDDLRKLVVEYIVCEIDTIGRCEAYVKYMEEGGEFVGDFWRMARDYMT